MDYFYMRVSTNGMKSKGLAQNFDRQAEIFRSHGFILNDANTFAEHVSGKTNGNDRAEFSRMLGVLQEGDTVHITETSRFARNYIAAMEMLDEMIFEKRVNVHIVSCSMMLEAGEKLDPYRWYTISQLLLTDELQRRIIGMNTKNGLAAKKEAGKRLGRPNAIDADTVVMMQEDRENGEKIADIAHKYGVSMALVSNKLKQLA